MRTGYLLQNHTCIEFTCNYVFFPGVCNWTYASKARAHPWLPYVLPLEYPAKSSLAHLQLFKPVSPTADQHSQNFIRQKYGRHTLLVASPLQDIIQTGMMFLCHYTLRRRDQKNIALGGVRSTQTQREGKRRFMTCEYKSGPFPKLDLKGGLANVCGS